MAVVIAATAVTEIEVTVTAVTAVTAVIAEGIGATATVATAIAVEATMAVIEKGTTGRTETRATWHSYWAQPKQQLPYLYYLQTQIPSTSPKSIRNLIKFVRSLVQIFAEHGTISIPQGDSRDDSRAAESEPRDGRRSRTPDGLPRFAWENVENVDQEMEMRSK